jgi:CBS domain-containing protein
MAWFKKDKFKDLPELPEIGNLSSEIPAVSEYLDVFMLPEAFKQAESDTLPVIDMAGNITGIVSEYDLAKVLPDVSFDDEGYRYHITVEQIMTKEVWTEPEHTNIKELLSNINQMHLRVIPIIDNIGRYTGRSITRTAIISYLTRMVKPMSLGGLATPLGVYLTDGQHQAGSGNPGLLLTGVSLAFIILIVQVITGFIFHYIKVGNVLLIIVQLTLFVLILRLTSFVKYHAAEHQTIYAIEKGLPLTPETVRMQPRPHRRCGTNLMILLVGIQLVLLISLDISKISFFAQFVFLIIGFLFIFSNWRKIGMWLQQYLTTAVADDEQIKNGIKVGEELLKKHKEDLNPYPPTFFEKLWNMGFLQILASFLLVLWIFDYILSHL